MRRSKLFLGITAVVLGLAALATSKAAHKSIANGYCTTTNSQGGCVLTTAGPFNASQGATAHCANGATVHTRTSVKICGIKLHNFE